MVGGAVRDLMRGEKVKDIDLEVFGIGPEALKNALSKNFEFDACGLSFGVLKIKHLDIDVALPRRESKRGIGHKGFMIDSDPSLSVAEAAMRRDFTINAMYYDPLDGVFEDPYCGRDDLENGILRHISSKFAEDPLSCYDIPSCLVHNGSQVVNQTMAETLKHIQTIAVYLCRHRWRRYILNRRSLRNILNHRSEIRHKSHYCSDILQSQLVVRLQTSVDYCFPLPSIWFLI